jgi:hypothetical protein
MQDGLQILPGGAVGGAQFRHRESSGVGMGDEIADRMTGFDRQSGASEPAQGKQPSRLPPLGR